MASPEERAATAKSLRGEVRQVLGDTGLFALLDRRWGQPQVTGSAGYDLMVWRDINLHMAVEPDRWVEWLGFAREVSDQLESVGLSLASARYINSYVEPHGRGSGLNWLFGFKDFAGEAWSLDIWGWDPFDYAVRQAREFTLRTDLSACDRDLILRLKTEARARPHYYGVRLSAIDVYEFAIAKAGTSLSDLERWKAAPTKHA